MNSKEITIKIHFTINGISDYYILEGTIEDIKSENETEMENRGLDPIINQMWSEKIN